MITAAPQAYRVLFSTSLSDDLAPGEVMVSRSPDPWNDFGYQTLIDILVRPRFETWGFIKLSGFLGFSERSGRHQDTRVVSALLETSAARRISGEDAPRFFTMLPDMAAYRELVRALGPEEARKVLAALRDVVETDFSGVNRTWLATVEKTPIYRQAFMRTAEAFFARKNAGMILRGVKFEQVGRLSSELVVEFQLAGRPSPHRVNFSFALDEPVLPKRFAVIIGKNGVGKSQTLRQIVESAIRDGDALRDGQGDRPSFNRLLAFEATASQRIFPTEQRRRSKVWYRRFSLNGSGQGRGRQTTAELVLQLVRTPEQIAAEDRFDIFMRALRAIDAHEELALIQDDPSDPVIPLSHLKRGAEQIKLDRYALIELREEVVRSVGGKIYPLSSGELSFLRFAAVASLHIENSSLLLFDEPETHLHPAFISQFVMLLDSLLERTGSAAIIATHSVYFVREAFEDQVRVLRSRPDRSVEVETPRMKTFGADVGTVSFFVFDEDEPSRLAKKVEREITERDQDWDHVFQIYRRELSPELLGEIRAGIEDNDHDSDKDDRGSAS